MHSSRFVENCVVDNFISLLTPIGVTFERTTEKNIRMPIDSTCSNFIFATSNVEVNRTLFQQEARFYFFIMQSSKIRIQSSPFLPLFIFSFFFRVVLLANHRASSAIIFFCKTVTLFFFVVEMNTKWILNNTIDPVSFCRLGLASSREVNISTSDQL